MGAFVTDKWKRSSPKENRERKFPEISKMVELEQSKKAMDTQTITVSGVSEEMLSRLDEKARQVGINREDYIREILKREATRPSTGLHPGMSFAEILAPIQAEAERLRRSEEEIDELIEKAREEVAREQHND